MIPINKLYYQRIVILLAFSLLCSCGWFGNKIEVTSRNFGEEIDLQQNLSFTFSKDLVSDSLIDKWVETEYIEFTPAVKGKYKWVSRNVLMFSPTSGFKPSTDYKAELTKKLGEGAEKKLSLADEHEFAFHTPYLRLVGTDIFWAMNQRGVAEVRMNMNFNYKINPADLAPLTKVQIDKQQAAYKVNTVDVSESIQIAVEQPKGAKYDDKALDIIIAKGLRLPESNYVAEEMKFESGVPSREEFRIVQATGEMDGEEMFIHIFTNQEVGSNEAQIKAALKITPQVNMRIEKLDAGFIIRGDYQPNENYLVSISKNLKGIFGGALSENFEQAVAFAEVQPTVAFTSKKAIYLTPQGSRNIGVRIMSVPQVKVTIYKIYRNNIISYLRESNGFNVPAGEDYYYDEYYEPYVEMNRFGDVVFEQEYMAKDFKKVAGVSLINLDFIDKNNFKGIYVINVASTEDQWLRASQTVAMSDIGFIVKESANDVLVFANSIKTTKPISGAEVTLVSSNNQDIYTAKTDGDGVAKFPELKSKAPGFKVDMVTAVNNEDFNYLHFQQTAVSTSRFEVGGLHSNEAGYQAFIYGDRALYRPDETVYLKTVVRDKDWKNVTGIPVKLKLTLPNGKSFATLRGTLSAQGTYETSIKLPASAVTGTYTAEVYTSNDVLLSSKAISVEEFMPDRIRVNPTLNKTEFKSGNNVELSVQALNMFGPPAANRKYEVRMSMKKKPLQVQNLPDYNFALSGNNEQYFNPENREGTTDEEGKFTESFELPADVKNIGLWEGSIYTTVFDESSRPVSRKSTFEVATQDLFYGVKFFDQLNGAREVVRIPLVAVNRKGQVATSAKARVQIIRHEWQSVLEKDENTGNYRYVSQRKDHIMQDRLVTLSGTATSYNYVGNISGDYEVRVMPPGVTDSYVSQNFYIYSYGSTQNSSFEVDKEGEVRIEMDKEKYNVGETAKLLFRTPFQGRMLVTVERGTVHDYFYVDTDKKSAAYELKIKKEYLPNVYVTATLIKPLDDSSIPLTVANGFQRLKAESPENKLNLQINAPASIRSNTKQEIVIKADKAESDIEVTVAVVDEGILQIQDYKTPDPYSFFFQDKALEVSSYNLYPRLFPELRSLTRNYGAGDDDFNLGKRVNPITSKRVKLVSFWSGTLRTDGNGEVRYAVNIPQFSGSLRIMAAAVKDEAFGSASKEMRVADPLVISTALPRFMSPGDEVLVPVTLTNTTGKSVSVSAQLNTSGAVAASGDTQESITVPANGEQQITFRVKAKNQVGTAKVSVVANAAGEKFSEVTDLSVRPVTSLLKSSSSGRIDASKTIDLSSGFIPSSVDAKLVISRSPLVEFGKDLAYLVQYPYGCGEQTISTAFPQLYVSEISKFMGDKKLASLNPQFNVQEAIRKLQTMQLYNGAISYWPGESQENWWVSAYGAHFMMEAQKAGFEVDKKFMDKLLSYLSAKLSRKGTDNYYYYDAAGNRVSRIIAPKEVFYSLYVLAMAGRQDISTMNYYKANQKLMAIDSRYLLAGTYMLLGDQASYRKVLPQSFSGEKSVNALDGSFYSYVRDEAISLNTLIETDPKNAQIPILAKHLSQQLKQDPYLNTQERAFAMLALGKLAKNSNQNTAMATISVGGKKIADFAGNTLVLRNEVAGKKVSITPTGGTLYYYYELEGLSESGNIKEEDNLLKVRRQFYDPSGKQLTGSTFGQTDLIVVKITLQSTGANVPNVVITDMLPAGFEIENPRLNGLGLDWATSSPADHVDFRDDRVNIFTTATPTESTYYYIVRAVSKGTYKLGVLSADAMYDAEYHSYHGGGEITVQ